MTPRNWLENYTDLSAHLQGKTIKASQRSSNATCGWSTLKECFNQSMPQISSTFQRGTKAQIAKNY
jgi:hypothetical protein